MPDQRDDEFMAALRAKLNSALAGSGRSVDELAELLPVPVESLRAYFSGKLEIPLPVLARYAQLVGRPIWWFFGEQPSTISIEGAETALGNLARMRVYLDAIESEFQGVLSGPSRAPVPALGSPRDRAADGPVVVDFAPYLSRARAILEREADFTEDSEEVFEESVEMIAHSLYSIEMASVRVDSKESSALPKES